MYNALCALGIQRGAEECERLCGCTMTDGVSPTKLLRGLVSIDGLAPVRIRERRRDIAMMRLHEAVLAGRPVILLVTTVVPDDHYVAVVGQLGDRYLVVDSADNELVVSRSPAEVKEWWGGGAQSAWGVVL